MLYILSRKYFGWKWQNLDTCNAVFLKRLIFQRNFILKQCRLVFRLNQYTYENSQSGYIHLPKLSDRSGPCISGVVEPRFGLAFGRLVTRPQSTKPGTLLLTVRHGVNSKKEKNVNLLLILYLYNLQVPIGESRVLRFYR